MNPETGEFKPNLPEWFEKTQGVNYAEVLTEELKKIQEDPASYFEGQRFYTGEKDEEGQEKKVDFQEYVARNNLTAEEVKPLLARSSEFILKDLGFEKMPEEIEELKGGTPGEEFPKEVQADFKEITETLTRRMHAQILRRMVEEYLPRRKVILHRGTFEKESKKGVDEAVKGETHYNVPWLLAKKIIRGISTKSESLREALTYGYKSPHFRIEQIKENIFKGVGGIEIDVKMNKRGEPVVTHSYLSRDIERAPHLDKFMEMIREVLPDDPQAPRQARRGLKLFLHTKMSSQDKYRDFPEAILRSLDKYDMGKQSVIMATRPETLYAFDETEERLRAGQTGETLKTSGPAYRFHQVALGPNKNEGLRHMFQYIPIGEISSVIKKWAEGMGKLGIKSPYYNKEGELHSLTNWFIDEHLLLNEFPRGKKLLDVLRRHNGIVGVSRAGYNKEFLAEAEEAGIRLSIGGYKGSEVDEMMEPDEQGRRPLTIEGLTEKAVFPEKGIPKK